MAAELQIDAVVEAAVEAAHMAGALNIPDFDYAVAHFST